MSDRYAVVGHPVAHSRSPWIHSQFARACAQDIEYTRIEPPLDGFVAAVDAFRALGGRGLNVTLPFKEQAFRYCNRRSARGEAAGAVNTIVFERDAYGDNTDGVGLLRDLVSNLQWQVEGKSVLLMGAGGAAQGVAGALMEAGIARLVIANRTPAKAQALAARLAGSTTGCGYEGLEGEAFHLVINATSAGLSNDAPALPPGVLRRGVHAYDMVYGRETPFLRAARAAGADAMDGLGMLVEQAAESFHLWRGVRPDTRALLARLRAE